VAEVSTLTPEVSQKSLETVVVHKSDCSLVNGYDWDTKIAFAICKAESGGNEKAYNPSNSNGSNDAGLLQINSIHVASGLISDQDRFDGAKNVSAAYQIYKGSGFRAWSAYNNLSYQKWL
jgi:soluble lytic murein transglycosylase-like protein